MYLRYSVIISPCKRTGLFIWTNLNILYPRMLCAKFSWNWHSGFGEKDENVKRLQQQQQQRRTTDKFWWEKLTWALGSGELMRKNYTSTNKGSMCHVAYLQKKIGTTWGHLSKRGKKSFFREKKVPIIILIEWLVFNVLGLSSLVFICTHFFRKCIMSSLIRTGSAVLEKKVFKSCHCNFDNCHCAFLE